MSSVWLARLKSCKHACILSQYSRTVHRYRSVHTSRMSMASSARTIWEHVRSIYVAVGEGDGGIFVLVRSEMHAMAPAGCVLDSDGLFRLHGGSSRHLFNDF